MYLKYVFEIHGSVRDNDNGKV